MSANDKVSLFSEIIKNIYISCNWTTYLTNVIITFFLLMQNTDVELLNFN